MRNNSSYTAYFRNFVFGVEDSLVSTVGLLSGVAVADASTKTLLLTGFVLVIVEAFSMAAGSLLSEYSADSYNTKIEKVTRKDIISSLVMFFSYLFSGLIPLLPYAFLPIQTALYVSIVASIVALFALGIVGALVAKIHIWKNAMRMVLVGGIAIVVGSLAGYLISQITP